MKPTLFVTAASVLILSACAGVQTSQGGAPAATATGGSGTMYCWKRSLEESGGTLLCNWEASTRDACKSIAQVRLAKGSVASGPRDAGRCDNGEWLVAISTK
jgi:hypothetical protein